MRLVSVRFTFAPRLPDPPPVPAPAKARLLPLSPATNRGEIIGWFISSRQPAAAARCSRISHMRRRGLRTDHKTYTEYGKEPRNSANNYKVIAVTSARHRHAAKPSQRNYNYTLKKLVRTRPLPRLSARRPPPVPHDACTRAHTSPVSRRLQVALFFSVQQAHGAYSSATPLPPRRHSSLSSTFCQSDAAPSLSH